MSIHFKECFKPYIYILCLFNVSIYFTLKKNDCETCLKVCIIFFWIAGPPKTTLASLASLISKHSLNLLLVSLPSLNSHSTFQLHWPHNALLCLCVFGRKILSACSGFSRLTWWTLSYSLSWGEIVHPVFSLLWLMCPPLFQRQSASPASVLPPHLVHNITAPAMSMVNWYLCLYFPRKSPNNFRASIS